MKFKVLSFGIMLILALLSFAVPASADNADSLAQRIADIAFECDGSKIDFKYFDSDESLGYAKFVTNEMFGVPFDKNADYSKISAVNSFEQLAKTAQIGDIITFGDDIAVVVSNKSECVKITYSYGWDNNNGHTETVKLTSANFGKRLGSNAEIWRKDDISSLYGNSESPVFGTPYTTVVGSDSAYIKCSIFRNECPWNFVGAYYGTNKDDMTFIGSDKLQLSGNTWSGYTIKDLNPNTIYYYKFFVSTSDKTYWSETASFTTSAESTEPSFGAPFITKVANDSAYIKCMMFKNGFDPNLVGAYIGTDPDEMKEWGNDKVGKILTWGGYTLKDLQPNTTYYYKFYLRSDDKTYWSDISSFKTTHDHDYMSETVKQPTCTSEGVEKFTCAICETEIAKPIALATHDYKDKVVAPTYLEQGYTLHTCSVCGESYTDTYTEKLTLGNVTGFKSAEITIDSVLLTWNRVSEAQGYIIYRYNFADKNWIEVARTISNIFEYEVRALPVGTVEQFAIKAYKMVEGKEISSPEYPILKTSTRPEPVAKFSVKSVTDSSITLTWSKVKNSDGYLLYTYDSAKKIWRKLTMIKDPSVTSYTASKLKSGTNYQYIIYSIKKIDDSQFASSETCLMAAYSTKPAAVSGFKVSSISADAVKLTWNKVSGAAGYIFYRYDNAKKTYVRVAKIGTSNLYTVSKLSSGTTYKFAVKAYKTYDGKELASVSFPYLTTSTNPGTVKFTLTAGSKKATVKWSKVTCASGYIIYYKTSKNGKWQRLTVSKGTSYTKSGLIKGKTYYFTVKAYRTVNGKTYNGAFAAKSVKIK